METDAAKDPLEAGKRFREALNFLCEYSIDQGYDLKFALEAKPNEPRGDIYLSTTGAMLGFIATLDHSDMVGVNPEVAHEQMAGLNFLHHVAQAWDGALYLDLERPSDRDILAEPDLYLDAHVGTLLVIDEVQVMPDLFATLRGQIDRRRRAGHRTGQFLLLGSASNTLLQQSAESLAGRVSYHELTPFTLDEVGQGALPALWLRGGFPERFLAASDRASLTWRADFIRTYL